MYQNKGNILFISDKQEELSRVRRTFVDDYNVFTAGSIRKGHAILTEYDMHVVLVNQQLPEMSGLQFCESIATEFPGITKIILTDSDDINPLERAFQMEEIYRFVQMPVSDLNLKMIINNALKLNQAEFKNRQLSDQITKIQGDQENILKLFKRYVPGEVVSRALKTNEEDMMKPGESRVVSVLFADMRGFTNLSSKMQPSEVVKFLNKYWEIISNCVKENNGSVNKYIGDGLLAVFGAPVSYINNHENAVSAAIDMVESLERINSKYMERLGTEVKLGIGINSGEVIVGNIGTKNFMEYTVIGNTVNIASRLETISKNEPNSIIISKKTRDFVSHVFETSELQKSNFPGEEEDIYYCKVLGYKSGNVYPMSSKKDIS